MLRAYAPQIPALISPVMCSADIALISPVGGESMLAYAPSETDRSDYYVALHRAGRSSLPLHHWVPVSPALRLLDEAPPPHEQWCESPTRQPPACPFQRDAARAAEQGVRHRRRGSGPAGADISAWSMPAAVTRSTSRVATSTRMRPPPCAVSAASSASSAGSPAAATMRRQNPIRSWLAPSALWRSTRLGTHLPLLWITGDAFLGRTRGK